MSAKTYMAKPGEVEAKWYIVDATDTILGRLSTELSRILQGKHKPEYTPHVDTGDFVVVINASKVKVTGKNKPDDRVYKRYSGYPGGLNTTSLKEMMDKHPDRVLMESVRKMLPKTKLGRAMLKKLKVFAGETHCHQAQQPEKLEL